MASTNKRVFYSQPEIVAGYDEQRFGGASGARVSAREIELALSMIPPVGNVLDLACGTGRLANALAARGQAVVGLDASPHMAAIAAETALVAIGNAFAMPFADDSFAAVAALRLAFHYPELGSLLEEMRRVTMPGGSLVLDTYTWSPRAAIAFGATAWGGRVHIHSRRRVAESAAAVGLRIDRAEGCFLFSPYLYRLAPLVLERAFEAMETRVPDAWLCRVFWKLTVPNAIARTEPARANSARTDSARANSDGRPA